MTCDYCGGKGGRYAGPLLTIKNRAGHIQRRMLRGCDRKMCRIKAEFSIPPAGGRIITMPRPLA